MDAWLLDLLITALGAGIGVLGTVWWYRRARRPAEKTASQELHSIARGLAHEIRNPLNTMSVTLQLLEEDLATENPPEPAELREQLERVRREVDRLERILSDFQRYARLMQRRNEPVEMAHLVEEVIAFMEPEAERIGVTLVPQIEPIPPIQADASLLKQAFLNLMINAFQVMEDGGTLTVRAEPLPNGDVRVTFSDTGPGIPSDVQDRIFEPFFSTKRGGTGLGLAVVKQVADLHGGKVDVRSEPGRGTTFSITLPADPDADPDTEDAP